VSYKYDRSDRSDRSKTASQFSVKRLEPETVLSSVELSGGRTVGYKSPKRISFAVVDADGNVLSTKNPVSGKQDFEVYPNKNTAEQVAAYYNLKAQS